MQYPINNKAIYHTWILVVLWTFQIILEITNGCVNGLRVAFLSWFVSEVNKYGANNLTIANCVSDSDDGTVTCGKSSYNSSYAKLGLAAAAFGLTFASIFFITHIVQIVQYARKRLSPKTNFVYECLRFVVTSLTLILNIASTAAFGTSVLTLTFVILVWFLYLLSMIYACVLFHRFRTGAYNNILPTQHGSPQEYQIQTVYPNKQEPIYSQGQYQAPYNSAPGVVPNPPAFKH